MAGLAFVGDRMGAPVGKGGNRKQAMVAGAISPHHGPGPETGISQSNGGVVSGAGEALLFALGVDRIGAGVAWHGTTGDDVHVWL